MYDLSDFNRLMVCLDMSKMDEVLLKYASKVVDTFGIKTVYFVHITNSFKIPPAIQEQYRDIVAPIDEAIEKQISFSLNQFFTKPESTEVKIKVADGKITDEIIKLSKNQVVDILMVGRKQGFKGSGLNEKKLAKASPTSVIMVPEKPSFNFKNILVSNDYSEYSRMAFEIGRGIQKITGAKLLSSNVYTVPRGYHAQGKTYEEFAEIMLVNTKHECEKFFKSLDLEGADYEHTFSLDNDQHPADKIYMMAKEKNADMIILGSKGRSAAAAFLLGSVAEQLMIEDADIPLFIVKKSNENLSFINTLLKI
jgi:nucleotide-binding universal stress UspA family protein